MELYHVNYFGYGALAHLSVVTALLGRKPEKRGMNPRLDDFKLVTQRLDQMPDRVLRKAPVHKSARSILQEAWPAGFRSYTIVPCKGERVKGQVYEINEQERALILEWELVPFGWMRELKNVAVKGGGIFYCTTEGLGVGQPYDHDFTVQNDFPPPLLTEQDRLIKTATRVGEEFRARK